MTLKQNITSILEYYFTGFKDEIIEACANRIMEQIERQNDTPLYHVGIIHERTEGKMTKEVLRWLEEHGFERSEQMTLEEAITYEEQNAASFEEMADFYHSDEGVYLHEETMQRKCAEICWQLVEWLKELKAYRETYPYGVDRFNGSDTPQTDCDKCIWNVCNYNKVEWDADTPQTDIPKSTLRTDCTGCKFVGSYDTEFPCANCVRKNKDYYDAEQTDCAWK